MRLFLLLLGAFIALLYLTRHSPSSLALNDARVAADFGDPIPGLSPSALQDFQNGRQTFLRRFTRTEGVGPHFNAVSCASCHEDPVAGGSSQRYRDFFLAAATQPNGTTTTVYEDCTLNNSLVARSQLCLPSLVVPHYGPTGTLADPVAAAVEHAPIPVEANVVARRNAPPLFGIGLFSLVADSEILSRADPTDADGDGISGRVNRIATENNAIGRFGFKCQTASVEAFNRGALQNQMGLTSDSLDLVTTEGPCKKNVLEDLLGSKTAFAQVAVPRDRIVDYDGVPDPEISRIRLADLVSFQENLAAPRRGPITPSVVRGREVFATIGCTDCHVTSLSTPLGLIYPFTDLLLHDMGPGGADGIVMGQASGSEFRTQPLWGLCQHPPFLHNGSADTVREAILAHGGEAEEARNGYQNLGPDDSVDLHRFLESL
jgi:CxxC motif-containing protein (DUF1111 family)